MSAHVDSHWFRQRFLAQPIEPVAGTAGEGLCPAAVLVPLVERSRGLHLILTRRSEHLREHAGQISFPGGRIEPHDRDPVAAALREAEEEIGLGPESVELLGRLPTYCTGTGFVVEPVVGLVDPTAPLRPEPGEVAEIFEVPLDFVLDTRNHRRHVVHRRGRKYRLWAMPYGEYFIWGATAGMLLELGRQLHGAEWPPAGDGE
ncbi:CoA pyrophosphatase [Sediminicurvatus halobius]|uniref:CoA pyrophosphatase n=1 Tax=Sediminicurvatus halobius TaxID=2182432 RepID=A0A2U2MWV3_9GAMM|nr:CoA pyrophosphatase [Spiribacter halobius]PWG61343.1 CoA pyrophosphatase [Spiribacter halobius]UEX76744.1 CoA pyrophosphatase [Spiribacter halobius]